MPLLLKLMGHMVFSFALKGECNFDHQGVADKSGKRDERGYWETLCGNWPNRTDRSERHLVEWDRDGPECCPWTCSVFWSRWETSTMTCVVGRRLVQHGDGLKGWDPVVNTVKGAEVPGRCSGQRGREHRSLRGLDKEPETQGSRSHAGGSESCFQICYEERLGIKMS